MNPNLFVGNGRAFKNTFLQIQYSLRFFRRNKVINGIDIPSRIERGPLDILKALSSTIEVDGKIPVYRMASELSSSTMHYRRVITLSMESGRTSAKWIVSEHPQLFQHKIAEPLIKAFEAPEKYTAESEVSESLLLSLINDVNVEGAIQVYKLLKEKGIDMQQSTKQQLLELVCFYNSCNKPDETMLEKMYYQHSVTENVNTWNDSFPNELLLDMEHCSASYSAMILGMIKYKNFSDAQTLYKEGQQKGIQFPLEVYNGVLSCASSWTFDFHDTHNHIQEVLKEMEDKKIKPNIYTLNSVLMSVVDMKKWSKSRDYAVQVFNEFTSIGIQPSLATYYYLLAIFFEGSSAHSIFPLILDAVEQGQWIMLHEDDIKFFPKAMEVSYKNFNEYDMAKRVHNILLSGNENFLYGNLNKMNYYRNYLLVALNHDFDIAYELYSKLVPNVYTPDPSMLLLVFNALRRHEKYDRLPKVWEDFVKLNGTSVNIMVLALRVMESGVTELAGLDVLNIPTYIWENAKTEELRIRWNTEFVSLLLKVFCYYKDFEKACDVFDTVGLTSLQFEIDSIHTFTDYCLSMKNKDKTLDCIEYLARKGGFNLKVYIQRVSSAFDLSKSELQRLRKIESLAGQTKLAIGKS